MYCIGNFNKLVCKICDKLYIYKIVVMSVQKFSYLCNNNWQLQEKHKNTTRFQSIFGHLFIMFVFVAHI